MKIDVINGQETVASWVRRHYEVPSHEEDIVAWWKSKTHFGTALQPAYIFTILRQCDYLELKELRNYLQEKVETSQILKRSTNGNRIQLTIIVANGTSNSDPLPFKQARGSSLPACFFMPRLLTKFTKQPTLCLKFYNYVFINLKNLQI